MSDEPKRFRLTFIILVAVSALPVLYVLSYGPALALFERDFVSVNAIDRAYAPLDLLFANDTARDAMQWYAGFWVDEAGFLIDCARTP